MFDKILDSCKIDSTISSARLMQWVGILTVLGVWVVTNISALIAAFSILAKKGVWTFTIVDLITIVALVGTLITGTTVQKFSKGDN